jgi:hypothetical protein
MIESLFIEIFGIEFTEANTAKIIAGGVFALLGFVIKYVGKVKSALDKENKFSICYFWADNWAKIIENLIIMFLCMRFSQFFLGVEPTMIIAVIIGYSSETLRKKFDDAINKFKD